MWTTPIQPAVLPQLASSVPGSAGAAALAATQAAAQQAPRIAAVQQSSAANTGSDTKRSNVKADERKTTEDGDVVELDSAASEKFAYDQTKVLRGTLDYLRKVIDPDLVDGEFRKDEPKESVQAGASREVNSDDYTPIESVDDLGADKPASSRQSSATGSVLDVEA